MFVDITMPKSSVYFNFIDCDDCLCFDIEYLHFHLKHLTFFSTLKMKVFLQVFISTNLLLR